MKKLLTISATLLAGLTLAACSSSSSSRSNNSSSESNTSTSSQSKKPLVSKKVSENSSSTSSKSAKTASVSDPKIIGLLAYQDVFGKGLDSETPMYFGPNTGNSDCDGQYILTSGSGSGTIYFSVNGDQVTIYKKDYSGGKSDAEARYTSYTVSLQELIDKFYTAPTQQQNAQEVAKNLKDANSSSDDSDQSDSSSDDDSSSDQTDDDGDDNSADQPSDEQDVDTNDDVDE